MIYGGKEIDIQNNETVLDVLNNIKKSDEKKNYFYIIKTPRCGGNRIRIGKSKTILKRFAEYENYYFDSNVYVLKLIVFNAINIGSNAKKPAEVFESLMKNKLKNIQNHKNKNDEAIQTEWYNLFTFYVNTPKGVVVTKQVPINTNLSLALLLQRGCLKV